MAPMEGRPKPIASPVSMPLSTKNIWIAVLVIASVANIALISRTAKVLFPNSNDKNLSYRRHAAGNQSPPLESFLKAGYINNRIANQVTINDLSGLNEYPPLNSLSNNQHQSLKRQKSSYSANSEQEGQSVSSPPKKNGEPKDNLHELQVGRDPTTATYAPKVTSSFCLLIKDDNDILNEWIAYHYHLVNLRHIIVAIDPSSHTSPISILEKWQATFSDFTFEVWSDKHFMPSFFLQGDFEKVPRMIKFEDKDASKWKEPTAVNDGNGVSVENLITEINNHRFRQSKFLQHCAKALQDTESSSKIKPANALNQMTSKHQWVTHIDTDEYIALNPALQDTGADPIVPIPKHLSSGSLLNFLENNIRADMDRNTVNWPCISMPRILYGSVEDDANDSVESSVATFFDRRRLETTRWKYHADYSDSDSNKQPKVIMDVDGFPPFNATRKAFSIHRPSMQLCRSQNQMQVQNIHRFPLVVHHYLGSWERYQARHDPRRTHHLYLQKAAVREGGKDSNEWIDPWLTHFVETHGINKVSRVMGQYLKGEEWKKVKGAVVENGASNIINTPLIAPAAEANTQSQALNREGYPKPPQFGRVLPLEKDSFSACLLIKDDNDILPEWIAYHYHVLKLRTLVVAIDPSSKTRPTEVLDRWRNYINIAEWTDETYMPKFFLEEKYHLVPNLIGNMTNVTNSAFHQDGDGNTDPLDEAKVKSDLMKINNHRFRQNSFLSECVGYLRDRNRTWMFHIDSDEYIVLHPQVRSQDHWRQVPLNPRIEPSLLLRLLKEGSQSYAKGLNYPCVSMPRLLYGSIEDDDKGVSNRFIKLPSGFDGKKFESLRWKYHAEYDVAVSGKPKAILDLSGIPPLADFLKGNVYSIHRPGLHLCRSDRDVLYGAPHRYPLTINHYIGSWERYSHREDARRSRQIYNQKALVNAGKDSDWIDEWIPSFVKEHGLETARYLLSEYTTDSEVEERGGSSVNQNGEDEIDELDIEDEEPDETPFVGNNDALPATNVGEAGDFLENMSSFNVSTHNEFSACLLVKDDNEILNEWIAYHYHVLGLRYMIVAVDAKSHTSPSALLQKWRNFGIAIEEWQDEGFMPDIYFQKAYHLQPRLVKIKKNKHKWLEGVTDPKEKKDLHDAIQDHRFRQITFLSECTKRLKEQGRTWMIHIDTDEYLVVNPKLRSRRRYNADLPIPTNAEASVVPKLLNQIVLSHWAEVNYPCVSLPRLLFGSLEDASNETIANKLGFNHSRFESLRWKYHTDFEDGALNKQPKVIMDVSAIPSDDKMFVDGRVFSIHRPSPRLCRTQGQMHFDDVEFFPFSVNHYLGTFERFGARDDPRRNRKLYDQKALVRAGKDEDQWIDSWLASFIELHGKKQVWDLLDDYRVQHKTQR